MANLTPSTGTRPEITNGHTELVEPKANGTMTHEAQEEHHPDDGCESHEEEPATVNVGEEPKKKKSKSKKPKSKRGMVSTLTLKRHTLR